MSLKALVRHPTLEPPKCNEQQRHNRQRKGPAYKRKVPVRTYGQTTNLGVRSSNLFGRANTIKQLRQKANKEGEAGFSRDNAWITELPKTNGWAVFMSERKPPISYDEAMSVQNSVLRLFNLYTKKDLQKYCKTAEIKAPELTNVILACEMGDLAWSHKISYRDFVPQHLLPTEAEQMSGELRIGSPIPKYLHKLFSVFEQRRYLVGHIFYSANRSNWHRTILRSEGHLAQKEPLGGRIAHPRCQLVMRAIQRRGGLDRIQQRQSFFKGRVPHTVARASQ